MKNCVLKKVEIMEKPILVKALLLIIFLSSFGNMYASNSNPKGEVEFLIADVEDIKSFAANEGKLVLLHFTASWCMPCQWMEKNTYKNENLAHFVNKNYLAKKIDIDDFEGRRLKDHYQVRTLPSILIFNPQGKLLDRINEAIEAEELYSVLSILNTKENQSTNEFATIDATYTNQEYISAPPVNISSKIRMPIVSDFETTEEKDEQEYLSIPDMGFDKPNGGRADYKIKPKKAYSVQIGVFRKRIRAQNYIAKHEKHLIYPAQIIPEVRGLSTWYKILVGEFEQKFDAQRYKTRDRKSVV